MTDDIVKRLDEAIAGVCQGGHIDVDDVGLLEDTKAEIECLRTDLRALRKRIQPLFFGDPTDAQIEDYWRERSEAAKSSILKEVRAMTEYIVVEVNREGAEEVQEPWEVIIVGKTFESIKEEFKERFSKLSPAALEQFAKGANFQDLEKHTQSVSLRTYNDQWDNPHTLLQIGIAVRSHLDHNDPIKVNTKVISEKEKDDIENAPEE